MDAIGHSKDALHESGQPVEPGAFACTECSMPVSLDHPGELPTCAACGSTTFRRASLFAEQPTLTGHAVVVPARSADEWLAGVRESLPPGKHLATWAEGRARVFELHPGWSRIGRAAGADIRLDDPTVSRRHAVVIRTPQGELRVLDDRSMNGIGVNGEVVDWAPIADGDALEIGRYTLYVIDLENRGED